jgi:Flp pilus assembly protein TadG
MLRKHNSEQGFMAVEWIGAVALLLLPVVFFMLGIGQYPTRKSLAQVGAEAAARAYVQATDGEATPLDLPAIRDKAQEAAVTAIADQTGQSRADVDSAIQVTLQSIEAPNGNAAYCPGSEATIEVSLPLNMNLDFFSTTHINDKFSLYRVSSTSTERVDDYAEVNSKDDEDGNCD